MVHTSRRPTHKVDVLVCYTLRSGLLKRQNGGILPNCVAHPLTLLENYIGLQEVMALIVAVQLVE